MVWGSTGHVLMNKAERRQRGGKLRPATKACVHVGVNPQGPGRPPLEETTYNEVHSS